VDREFGLQRSCKARANASKPSGTRQVGLLIPNLGTAELFDSGPLGALAAGALRTVVL